MATTYIKGDRAVYTGKSELLYGDIAYEVEIIEGRNKGKKVTTYRKPGTVGAYNPNIKKG